MFPGLLQSGSLQTESSQPGDTEVTVVQTRRLLKRNKTWKILFHGESGNINTAFKFQMGTLQHFVRLLTYLFISPITLFLKKTEIYQKSLKCLKLCAVMSRPVPSKCSGMEAKDIKFKVLWGLQNVLYFSFLL